MPVLVTPRELTRRAELYHQLSQLTSAGVGLVQALEQIKRSPPAPSFRQPLRRLIEGLAQGRTFTESVQQTGWLPTFDIALLDAGERSGRLEVCLRLLADHCNERARVIRQMIADLMYPVFVYHLAVLVVAMLEYLWMGPWLLILLGGFIPVYAAAMFLIYAGQSRHSEAWRAKVESLVRPVPLLGTARQYLALSRLAAALEALISSGVRVIEAWDLAAAASGSPALHHAVLAWKPQVLAGQTPSEAVQTCRQFPETFAHLYASGEVSGKLDDSLQRLHRYYGEEGFRKLHLFSQWMPRLIYLCVVVIVAYIVIRGGMAYFNQINRMSHF